MTRQHSSKICCHSTRLSAFTVNAVFIFVFFFSPDISIWYSSLSCV